MAGKTIGLFNSEGLDEQLVSKIALGVGLEEDDGEAMVQSLQTMTDLTRPLICYLDFSTFVGKVGVTSI
jgi:hypothetical protein